jgi:5-methylcytosine-specific restriction endonuclease McrA
LNYTSTWRRNNPARVREVYQRQDAVRRLSREERRISLSLSQWRAIKDLSGGLCVYCGASDPIELDHLVPKRLGGLPVVGNCLPACRRCNASKGPRDAYEWLTHQFGAEKGTQKYQDVLKFTNKVWLQSSKESLQICQQ